MPVAWIRLISLVVAIAIAPAAQETVPGLGAGRAVAPGVLHFTLTDPALLDPPAPISVQLLRLDLTQVDLTTDLSLGDRQGRATVLSAARRRQAIAAVNAGFFSLNNGDPIGPLRVDGELVSDGTLGRAAAAMIPNGRGGKPAWLFDRAGVALTAVLEHGGEHRHRWRRHDAGGRRADALHAALRAGQRHGADGHRMGPRAAGGRQAGGAGSGPATS